MSRDLGVVGFDERTIGVLRGFNVRFVEQLAPIAATFEGKFALAKLLELSVDAKEFQSLLKKLDSILADEHGISLSTPRKASTKTSYAVMAQKRYGLGYPIPELRDIKFGDLLPPRAGPGGGGAGRPAPTAVARHSCAVTPVRDQYFRGTCVAFAAVALLEAKILRQTGRKDIDLSEQYLYFRARQLDPDRKEDGTYPRYAYDALVKYGTCEEALWSYNWYNDWGQGLLFQTHPHPLADLDIAAANNRIQSYQGLPPNSVDDIKSTLLTDQLVSIGVPVFENSWYNSGFTEQFGEIALPLTRQDPVTSQEILLDTIVGGHALAIAGFQDTPDPSDINEYRPGGGYFIVKNSWGTAWAWNNTRHGAGFGQLPYDYVRKYNWDAHIVS